MGTPTLLLILEEFARDSPVRRLAFPKHGFPNLELRDPEFSGTSSRAREGGGCVLVSRPWGGGVKIPSCSICGTRLSSSKVVVKIFAGSAI